MSDPVNFASDTNYTNGTDPGSPTKVDPGVAPMAEGFVPGEAADPTFLNFVLNWIIASFTTAGRVLTAGLASGAVTPAKLGIGTAVWVETAFVAGGTPANADDVTISYTVLGAGTWKKVDAFMAVASGNSASQTSQIRTAAAGGGSAVTSSLSGVNANTVRDAQSAQVTGITSATQHFMRRTGGSTPSGTVGSIWVLCVRTA